jgi:hypothetical protein
MVLDLAQRNGYARLFVRTHFALAPIAAARRDGPLMDDLLRWMGDTTTELPGSLFGKVMVGALRLHASDLDRAAPFTPDPRVFLPAFGEEATLPSLRGALDRIFTQWLVAGELDAATDAVAANLARTAEEWIPLGPAVATLFSARLAAAKQDSSLAARDAVKAAGAFRDMGAAWWLAKAIRVLDDIGAADPALTNEAFAIEERLGVLAPLGL